MTWSLDSQQASWSNELGKLQLTLAAPELGARVLLAASNTETKEIWGALHSQIVPSPATVEEAYVRGSDLVVNYAEHPETRLTTSLVWRALPLTELAASRRLSSVRALWFELVVATRTSTLGVQPQAEVISVWPVEANRAPEPVAASNSNLLSNHHPLTILSSVESNEPAALASIAGSSGQALSRLTWVHPSDGSCRWQSSESTATSAHRGTIHQQLNLPLLEKGVIRSARVRWLLCDGSLDPSDFQHIVDVCMNAQLPIST